MKLSILKQKKYYIPLIILLVVVVGFFINRQQSPKITYKEYSVTRGNLAINILATGSVQPENRIEIKPPVAGRIDLVVVDQGVFVKKGQILAWMSSTERAALLDAARAHGPAEVKRWEELYKAIPVVAPLNGTIILRNIDPGQTVAATDSLYSLSDRLIVNAQVDETDIAQVKPKEVVDIVLDAYPDQKIPAKVIRIAFDAKTVNSVTTYEVDVLPDETPPLMKSGMTANVTFYAGEKDNVILVPNEALKYLDGHTKVSLQNSDGKIEERELELGVTDGKKTEVLSGLEENDIVVRAIKPMKTSNGINPFAAGMSKPKGH